MIAALTGVPGTGKTAVGKLLAQRGFEVVELGPLVERKGLWQEVDAARGSKVVDPRALSHFLQATLREARQKRARLVLEGHLAHLVQGVEVAVVLRCHPGQLAERLRARGWSEAKVKENCQAEALDAITQEAVEEGARVLEADTTALTAEQAAGLVASLLEGRDASLLTGHRPGSVDWGDEVLSWS